MASAPRPLRRITPAQLAELRALIEWSDGDGLDAASAAQLIDEVEQLRSELEEERRQAIRLAAELARLGHPAMP
jgi:hypothetical protein